MKNSGKLLTMTAAILSVVGFFVCADRAFLQNSPTSEAAKIQAAPQAVPRYQIVDLGVAQTGDTSAQGFGVSTDGVAVGRSIRTGAAQAFSWTRTGGIVGLPSYMGRNFCVANAANDAGRVVGNCATTLFGTARVPVIWHNGVATNLPLPEGQTLGDANDINAFGLAVGSVNSGSLQRAVFYNGLAAAVITQTTANGSYMVSAFGINDANIAVGNGIDPNNAARNVGIVYDIGNNTAAEVGALPNANGALAFGISNTGLVVGSSMQNQGSGLPFIWSRTGGMQAIPLPAGTSSGSARAVNSIGWAVGTASSAFAIPFLYDGTTTYRLQDLIPAGTGWDLSTNTSSSALGISDTRIIVGTGVLNGQVRAFAMIPVSTAPYDFFGTGRTSFASTTTVIGFGQYLVWHTRANGGNAQSQGTPFGTSSDLPAAADYNGDGISDIAIFRNGIWSSYNNLFPPVQFGQFSDVTVPSDYTGDKRAEVAVFRNGMWYTLDLTNNQTQAIPFGIQGDRVVPADYDGDGKTDFAVFRDGVWYWLRSSDNQPRGVQFGAIGDKPLTGDYDGDGRADQAVFRSGVWYLNRSTEGFYAVQFGLSSDIPLVGDYNGDGRSDIAVYRPSTAVFYWFNSPTNAAYGFQQHGGTDYTPIAYR